MDDPAKKVMAHKFDVNLLTHPFTRTRAATLYVLTPHLSFAIDHRHVKTVHPVRSGKLKHVTGEAVVWWETTCEGSAVDCFASFLLRY